MGSRVTRRMGRGVVERIMQARIVRRCCLRCKFEVGCIEYPVRSELCSQVQILFIRPGKIVKMFRIRISNLNAPSM